jgi:hypothetical protein
LQMHSHATLQLWRIFIGRALERPRTGKTIAGGIRSRNTEV